MTPEMQTLLAVLKQHRDPMGEVNSNEKTIREWIGSEAATWPIHGMVLGLRDLGQLKIIVAEGGGDEEGTTLVVRV